MMYSMAARINCAVCSVKIRGLSLAKPNACELALAAKRTAQRQIENKSASL